MIGLSDIRGGRTVAGFVASAEVDIKAPPERVWQALTDPAEIKQYFFGSDVESDWRPGSPIVWSGEYEGKSYEDKGEVLEVEPNRLLKHTHYSPMSGQPDEPGNYHTLTYKLVESGDTTHVSLTQDNNGDEAEASRASATSETVLNGLKDTVEGVHS
jgi:uncharacterized protein YndB with AHSA1/START domain